MYNFSHEKKRTSLNNDQTYEIISIPCLINNIVILYQSQFLEKDISKRIRTLQRSGSVKTRASTFVKGFKVWPWFKRNHRWKIYIRRRISWAEANVTAWHLICSKAGWLPVHQPSAVKVPAGKLLLKILVKCIHIDYKYFIKINNDILFIWL